MEFPRGPCSASKHLASQETGALSNVGCLPMSLLHNPDALSNRAVPLSIVEDTGIREIPSLGRRAKEAMIRGVAARPFFFAHSNAEDNEVEDQPSCHNKP